MSPTKDPLKSRNQRLGSRLQELEYELAKIHQKSPILASSVSSQTLTPPLMIYSSHIQQTTPQGQTVYTGILPITSTPVASLNANIISQMPGTEGSQHSENSEQCEVMPKKFHHACCLKGKFFKGRSLLANLFVVFRMLHNFFCLLSFTVIQYSYNNLVFIKYSRFKSHHFIQKSS